MLKMKRPSLFVLRVEDNELGVGLEVVDVAEGGVVVCSHGPCQLLYVSIGVEDQMASSRVVVYVEVTILREEEW
jgi:hypothetical protein